MDALAAALGGARGRSWRSTCRSPRAARSAARSPPRVAGPRAFRYGTARDLLIGITVVLRRRHDRQVRRQGGQERRGLRPGQAVHRLVRHARRDRRGHVPAASAARRAPLDRRRGGSAAGRPGRAVPGRGAGRDAGRRAAGAERRGAGLAARAGGPIWWPCWSRGPPRTSGREALRARMGGAGQGRSAPSRHRGWGLLLQRRRRWPRCASAGRAAPRGAGRACTAAGSAARLRRGGPGLAGAAGRPRRGRDHRRGGRAARRGWTTSAARA